MKIAFYAPLKSPYHPKPSGDRLLAQLFIQALTLAGHNVMLMSEFRSYDGSGSDIQQKAIKNQAEAEANQILNNFIMQDQPDLWLTYHSYHKAPDWIGPIVSRTLKIPYILAEASISPKQANGPWKRGYLQSIVSAQQAAAIININNRDIECLKPALSNTCRLLSIPPFLEHCQDQKIPHIDINNPLRLCAVAMMRSGDKYASWIELSNILKLTTNKNWQLTAIGDGEKRTDIESHFEKLGASVTFRGELDQASVLDCISQHDLLIWPGINEALGMVYLEAKAIGRMSIAGRYAGVPQVIQHGFSGVLYDACNVNQAAQIIDYAVTHRRVVEKLNQNAAKNFTLMHSIESASKQLDQLVTVLCET